MFSTATSLVSGLLGYLSTPPAPRTAPTPAPATQRAAVSFEEFLSKMPNNQRIAFATTFSAHLSSIKQRQASASAVAAAAPIVNPPSPRLEPTVADHLAPTALIPQPEEQADVTAAATPAFIDRSCWTKY